MPSTASHPAPSADPCLIRLVTHEMASDPGVEAVKLDRTQGAVSVATLGQATDEAFAGRLSARLQKAQEAHQSASRPATEACGLLAGSENCADCPLAAGLPDQGEFTVMHQPGTTTIARVTCPTAPRFWRWRMHPWPRLVPREVRLPEGDEEDWKPQLLAAALCGLAGLLAAFVVGPGAPATVVFALAYLAGGWYPAIEVWKRLRHRQLDVHFLMLAVAVGAASIGAWEEGAILLFLFSFSGALEQYALGRTHREIRALIRGAPKEATVLQPDGTETRLPVESLAAGMRLVIRPGDLFPVDAEVTRGATAADEANLTGEAVPVEKRTGDTVFGGTLNLWGAIEATVLKPAQESALQRIIQLIRRSQALKAPSQRLTDRFGTGYTFAILGLTVLMFFVWWLALDHAPFVSTTPAPSAFYLAMTLLVVASPCALVLSIPSAVLAAIAHGARRGILFRGGAAVEKLAEVNVVAMDKTGTLTTGELRVDALQSWPPGRETDVARVAFGIERLSTHPLARAITRYGKQHELPSSNVTGVESLPGLGIRARVEDLPATLGRRSFVLAEAPPQTPDPSPAPGLEPATEPGTSEVWLRWGDLTGRITLRDDIRPQARHVVARLKAEGLWTIALTGDRKATADHLQRHLELDEVRAELHPEDKVAAILDLTRSGRRVAMIGDGVNDAPALAVAHVGVAMGARGSDAALEQADIVLMHDRLERFQVAFELSRRARRVIRQNLALSLGTLAVLAVLALAARLPLTRGVLGHEGSTVLVVLNSLRLLFPVRRGSAGEIDPAPSPSSTTRPSGR